MFASVSGDNRLVVTGTIDGPQRVWDARTGEPVTPLLKQVGDSFSPEGGYVLMTRGGGNRQKWRLPRDTRPVSDLLLLSQLLSGHKIDATGGLAPVDQSALQNAWRHLSRTYPSDFDVSSPQAWFAWHQRQAEDAEKMGAWAVAVSHLDPLIRARPRQWELWVRRAQARAQLGQWHKAAVDYARATRLGADDPTVRLSLAIAHQRLGRAEEARKSLREAVPLVEREVNGPNPRGYRIRELNLLRQEAESLIKSGGP
jgi:tetratricopeptide (TPR) repeat protein